MAKITLVEEQQVLYSHQQALSQYFHPTHKQILSKLQTIKQIQMHLEALHRKETLLHQTILALQSLAVTMLAILDNQEIQLLHFLEANLNLNKVVLLEIKETQDHSESKILLKHLEEHNHLPFLLVRQIPCLGNKISKIDLLLKEYLVRSHKTNLPLNQITCSPHKNLGSLILTQGH